MIILIAGQKGGSGKSTLATNIAAWLAVNQHDVMLVDADRQGTAARWAEYREEDNNLPVVHCVQKHDNIMKSLKDLNSRYEFVVCDVAGRDSKEMRSAFFAAHLVIIPFRPSQADLDTLPNVCDIISDAIETGVNPNVQCLALLTLAPTNPVISETREAEKIIEEYPELTLLKTIVCDRKVYRDALSEGKGVVEMSNDKATCEINQLMMELL